VLLSALLASSSLIETVALMLLFSLCWAAASFDLTFRIIPNETIAAIFVLGLAMIPLGLSRTGFQGYFLGALLGGTIYLLPHLLGGKAGGGDVKLMAAIGGITGVTGVLIVSILMGLLIFGYSILSITSRNLTFKRAIPLGPYMATSLLLFMIKF
jgi:leader peptidase (prepilin peptidase)/N-methyltransferase